jgi:hypothetical protein
MFCSACGKAIEDGSRFCRYCGSPQAQEPGEAGTVEMAADEPVASTAKKAPPNRTGLAIGIVLAIILLIAIVNGSGSGKAGSDLTNTTDTAAAIDSLTDNMTAVDAGASEAAPVGNWTYSTDEDKLNGAKTYIAQTVSTNEIQQAPPYGGGTRMTIHVRKHPRWGTAVYMTITEGQLMCSSYDGCSAMVRFDNAPASRVSMSGPEDNSSEVMFVDGASSFLRKLRNAKHVVVEKTMYQAGAQQFEFNVSGLKWDHS